MTLRTPMKAIRAKCVDCSGGSRKEVAECVIPDCAIYPYRFGKRPSTVEKKSNKQQGIQQA